MHTKDFEMDKMEADFRKTINEATAARREIAELEEAQEERERIAIEYMKQYHRELRREKAWDRLYMAFALVMLVLGLYSAYSFAIIPLALTVPAEIVCASFAFGCVVDAVRLFKGGKRK